MDIERFTVLADIHGSDLTRWPEAEREAARALSRTPGPFAATLAAAARLDEALDAWTATSPSNALRAQVIASAPNPRIAWRRGIGFWLSGAGLATAGLVGVLCGAAVSTAALGEAHDEALVVSATTDGAAGLTDEGRPAPHVSERTSAT